MSVKKTVVNQYQRLVNETSSQVANLPSPPQGWVHTVRTSLSMSGAQLARRLGVTRASVSQTERNEALGKVTLAHLQRVAEAMDCHLVYAIVPRDAKDVHTLLRQQAEQKARDIVRRASAHMALEKQALSKKQNETEISQLADELLREMPSDFWEHS